LLLVAFHLTGLRKATGDLALNASPNSSEEFD